MTGEAAMPTELVRLTIGTRLRAGMPEIDEAIFRELRASVPDAVGNDPEYESGLFGAVREAVAHCIGVIEGGTEDPLPLPPATVDQARRAARHGVGIETVVHRVALGERMVQAFASREADDLPARELSLIFSSLGPAVDRLVHGLTEAHQQERERLESGLDGHRLELIDRLLAGEAPGPTDDAALRYSLCGWHIHLIGTGPGVEDVLRHLAETLGCSMLFHHRGAATASAWLGGGSRRLDFADVRRQPAIRESGDVTFVVGDPGEGLEGWRRTHEQARLALLPGRSRGRKLTLAADVLPEAMLSTDRARAKLLVSTYLSALDGLRRNGEPARETLRAYFANDRNVSATACSLGVARGTVENRVREVEKAIGKPLYHEHLTRLELGLRLEDELAASATGTASP
jgi:hypothetical protein